MALTVVTRAQDALTAARERFKALDLVIRVNDHYGKVHGAHQAGASTYFGFLSFFPILALAVFVVGLISQFWPEAEDGLTDALNQVIPGLIGNGEGQIALSDLERFSGWAGVVGVLGVLYAGTGWISAMRTSLFLVFEMDEDEKPNFIKAKLLDIVALIGIGAVLLISVVGVQTLTSFSSDVAGWLGFESSAWLTVLSHLLSWAVSVLLFFMIFRLIGRPNLPQRSLWEAAAIAGFAFEVLKFASFLVLGSVRGSPAFQAFGVALVLLVWINYFSRVTFYAASYAVQVRPPLESEEDKATHPDLGASET